MTVAVQSTYAHHQAMQTDSGARLEMLLTMLLFGAMGAITWAIRGSNGWGGIDGTLVPGMTWGALWAYVCARKGIDAGLTPIILGLGISIGGELGYGQYVSWIRGMFNVGDDVIPIAPWIGYAWFVIAGIGWGSAGGVALGWALTKKHSPLIWLTRILLPAALACLAYLLVQTCPQWVFPHYDPVTYAGIHTKNFDPHLDRTVYTNTQNFTVLAWFVGVLLVATFQKDRVTLVIAALIGAGFGIGFTLAALWCLGYSVEPNFIDWWKIWELQAGFNLGLLYTLALYWTIRQRSQQHPSDPSVPRPSGSGPPPTSEPSSDGSSGASSSATGGSPAGAPLGTDQSLSPRTARHAPLATPAISRRARITYVLTITTLLWIAFRGVSLTLGGILNFYEIDKIGQYTWPPARTALFLPALAILLIAAAWHLWQILHSPQPDRFPSQSSQRAIVEKPATTHPSPGATDGLPASAVLNTAPVSYPRPTYRPDRLIDLMTTIALIGAISIWPAKIAILYAASLALALFAFTRLNRHFDLRAAHPLAQGL
jgi:hypothetical protein